ncbi:MAG: HAD-IA family hydrolase [Lachnospiraceae bacterium]|nr:HAD-IA family hydrolase [Lachnospiraceae bacterium]MCD8249168.1 HAD-IA family hydrolase [Lachnospiraceae bacterium]
MRNTVIFDMDGTLLDTLEDIYLSVNAVLGEAGLPLRTLDEIRQFVGVGSRALMRRCIEGGEAHPKFETCYAAFQKYYHTHLNDHTVPYEGVVGLLDALRQAGFLLAIVSNKSDSAVKELNSEVFGERIPVAIGAQEGVHKKPAPDTVYAAMRELGVEKDVCVYVGDSETDLETAANAGIPCVCVAWGFRGRAALEDLGAERIADTAGELLDILKEYAGD